MSNDWCWSTATELRASLADGSVSATTVVESMLDRIDTVDPRIGAYRVVLADQAREEAAAFDRDPRRRSLPLGGVPIAIKDNLDVAGTVTAWGSVAQDRVAPADAPIVAQLREAGAIVLGKTQCSELAVWPFTENAWGKVRNPWDIRYSAGGSSGGSAAAVAAGLCTLAVGSDGLGSIRAPASFNGVFGLKPQKGRLWSGDLDWKGLSSHGPLTRSVADAGLFLEATSLPPFETGAADAALTAPGALRIALSWQPPSSWPMAARLGDDQRRATSEAADVLRAAGHTVDIHQVPFPRLESNSYLLRYLAGVAENAASVDRPGALTRRTAAMARYGRLAQRLSDWTASASTSFADALADTFATYDLVLTPGAVGPPMKVGAADRLSALPTLLMSGRRIPHFAPYNATGQPAASIPIGFSSLGLPTSVQLAARPDDELTLLRVARQLEGARPWRSRRPPFA